MKIVAIKKMSAGNDSVGSEWMETKVFDETEPISRLVEWGLELKQNIIISLLERE